MNRGKVLSGLLAIVVLAIMWGGVNWYRTDQDCDRLFGGAHATLRAATAPRGWLPGDAVVCHA